MINVSSLIFNVRRNVNNEQKNNMVSGSEGTVIVFDAHIKRFYVTGKRSFLFEFQGIQNVNVDWDLFLMLTYR